jgi:hypothetical protein
MGEPMTKKRKLGDLIKEETQRPEVELETVEPKSEQLELPKYLTLIRKETRLREDQLEKLTVLTRKLNRQRRGGERITENTLIRVAIDLLLEQSEELKGSTESELREALGLLVAE